jgi:hypothetical protein
MEKNSAAKYIRDNFEPNDRLAVVLINKRSGEVEQRLATAERIAAEPFQRWLRLKNANRFDVYVSMNTLHADARGRTKDDIEAIRHIYLDFDNGGAPPADTPTPNYIVNTSPGKWQTIWRVTGFEQDQAETLQRGLARDAGADIAATDSTRVLRIPHFYNHKRSEPHYIRYEQQAIEIYTPDRFPQYTSDARTITPASASAGAKSQSENDWAYARRALARGEPEAQVIQAIAEYRTGEKPDADYYAELTVGKAAASLRGHDTQPDR